MYDALFVARNFVMDPEHDDLLFDGTELKPGMIVLLEDQMLRGDPENDLNGKWTHNRVLENARWCTVLRVKIQDRYQEDERGRMRPSSPLVSFMGEYSDGTKSKRTYDACYSWYVKKASIQIVSEQGNDGDDD